MCNIEQHSKEKKQSNHARKAVIKCRAYCVSIKGPSMTIDDGKMHDDHKRGKAIM